MAGRTKLHHGQAIDYPGYNLLTNPGFEIWQRGAGAFTASGAYTADRWQQGVVTSTLSTSRITSTIGTPGYSLQFTYTHAGGGLANCLQYYEDFAKLKGKTVTFAISVKCSVDATVALQAYQTTGSTYSSYNSGTGEQILAVTVTVNSSTTALAFGIICAVTSCVVEVNDATLCLGTAPLPYVPLHPAEEWERCERYCERSYGPTIANGTSTDNGVVAFNTGNADNMQKLLFIPFRVSKPVNTTVTTYDRVGNIGKCSTLNPAGSAWTNNQGISAYHSSTDGFSVYITTTEGGFGLHYMAEANP